MGILIIVIGWVFALVVYSGVTYIHKFSNFESIIVSLLSWILFNQLIYFLAKEDGENEKQSKNQQI